MKKLILLFAICVFILPGCRKRLDPLEDRQVVIFFSARPQSSSQLKSSATSEENSFSRIILYGVDNQNNVVKTFPAVDNPPVEGIHLTIPINVKSLYAIANPTTTLEGTNPVTLSALLALTSGFSTAPQPPFLMSGNGNVLGYNVNIELVRSVAKIEMEGINGFKIESVMVKDSPDQGYVFRREPVTVPSVAVPINYPAVFPFGSLAIPTLYLAENSGGINPKPTQFIITGQFGGKHANYTVVLSDGGVNIDIVRNTYYKIYISPITDSDCTIIITIPEWKDAFDDDNPYIIYIPDEDFI